MKNFIQWIWEMPAKDFLFWLVIVSAVIVSPFVGWFAYLWRDMKKAEKNRKRIQSRFRR
jgi:hypothetical protein